ncbi:DUF3806 domain-containing protein [Flavobacterium sp. GSB-24]|uniref:DUF3806 domain-containing protein n=1 Tax=Flavobacterium sp. GSB-24 TaxID=2994319 RepID=UPI0024921DB8|nr:DUF3806 domain-containing protein [Flavobacterium sp. GSB-24]BDU23517.1 hypothetical protein FLGSB24_02610 [Flavobacterium sp. GSB-24]
MRLFEIGDGLISIKVSNNYNSELENDDTIILYDLEKDFATIRISIITVESKNGSDKQPMFNRTIEEANKKGIKVNIEDQKSFYGYITEDKKEDLSIYYFEVGYLNHLIIISVTTTAEYSQNNEESLEDLLQEITGFIPSITEINLETQNIFEPRYENFIHINERIATILNIKTEEIDNYHNTEKTIHLLQEIIDKEIFQADQSYELESLGIALGDYIQYKHNDFHWAIIRDEYGRDYCLQYKTFAINVFPSTMILKRIENGEYINISELVSDLIYKVNELTESEEFDLLDHND